MSVPADLRNLLKAHDQEHLVDFWERLDDAGRERLAGEIREVDFRQVRELYERQSGKAGGGGGSDAGALAAQAGPPGDLVRQPVSQHDRDEWHRAAQFGEGM